MYIIYVRNKHLIIGNGKETRKKINKERMNSWLILK